MPKNERGTQSQIFAPKKLFYGGYNFVTAKSMQTSGKVIPSSSNEKSGSIKNLEISTNHSNC